MSSPVEQRAKLLRHHALYYTSCRMSHLYHRGCSYQLSLKQCHNQAAALTAAAASFGVLSSLEAAFAIYRAFLQRLGQVQYDGGKPLLHEGLKRPDLFYQNLLR